MNNIFKTITFFLFLGRPEGMHFYIDGPSLAEDKKFTYIVHQDFTEFLGNFYATLQNPINTMQCNSTQCNAMQQNAPQ